MNTYTVTMNTPSTLEDWTVVASNYLDAIEKAREQVIALYGDLSPFVPQPVNVCKQK